MPLRLYKRTFFSTHARNDEWFFERVLGIATVHNYTYHAGYNRWRTSADGVENGEEGSGKWTCAQRIEMSALAYQVCVFTALWSPRSDDTQTAHRRLRALSGMRARRTSG